MMSQTETQVQPSRSRSRSRSRSKTRSLENKPIRVWCPGSFDVLNYEHVCFLEKVRSEMGKRFPKVELIVGLYSDQELEARGRKTVFSLGERFDMMRANKWVDDIVKDAPIELSKNVLNDQRCDYAFCLEGSEDSAIHDVETQTLKQELVDSELLKFIPTCNKFQDQNNNRKYHLTFDLINRMLQLEPRDENENKVSGRNWDSVATFPTSLSCKEMVRIANVNSIKKPKPTDKIVYVDGSFDLLHPGHLALLEKAQSLGDFLYVGLFSDETIASYAGKDYPVMKWNERLLSLLSCKYVSEVVIDAPLQITDSLIDAFSVSCVVGSADDYPELNDNKTDRFAVARERKIYYEKEDEKNREGVANNSDLTTIDVITRVHQNWRRYTYASANPAD